MKKTLCLILALGMSLTFFACTKQAESSAPPQPETVNLQNNETSAATPQKPVREPGKSPEEIALMFCRKDYNTTFEEALLLCHPESDYYQQIVEDEELQAFLESGLSPLDFAVEQLKNKYAEKGRTIADEAFVKAFYEKATAQIQYSVAKTTPEDEDTVSVAVDITNDFHDWELDFSAVTLENTDMDKFIEESCIHYYTYHVTLKNYDGEWYVEYAMVTADYGG